MATLSGMSLLTAALFALLAVILAWLFWPAGAAVPSPRRLASDVDETADSLFAEWGSAE